MPVYDYKCAEHGIFYGLASMSDSDKPKACPNCGSLSAKIIRLPPEIFTLPAAQKQAYERNEKSQHQPEISTLARRQEDELHTKGCGCQKKISKSKMFLTAQGNKIFPSMRPWMISH